MKIVYVTLTGDVLSKAAGLLTEQEYKQLSIKESKGIAAMYDNRVIGVLLFKIYSNRVVMSNIFVDPRFRLMGIGSGLLKRLAESADKSGFELIFSFEAEGIFDKFYRFTASTRDFYIEKQDGCTALIGIEDVSSLCEKYPQRAEPKLFFEQSGAMREELLSVIEPLYPDTVWELRNNKSVYRADLCTCTESGGHIQSVCLIKEEGGQLELKLLFSRPGNGAHAAKALTESIGQLGKVQLMPIRFTPMGGAAVKIMKNICPTYKTEKWIYTAYYVGAAEEV